MSRGLPRISIVTPSYNQAQYLESTIQSVLTQGYPNLEYVIIDGGSTDGSIDIIRRYESQLAYWTSEPDQGQYDALNKGFTRTTGEIMAYINSDDMYTRWAFAIVADIFATLPEVDWLTTLCPLFWDSAGRAVRVERLRGFSRQGFLRGEHLPKGRWYTSGLIQQESTFWRRSLWERSGGRFDASLALAGDFELWARFFQHADVYGVPTPLGGFRRHGVQKSAHHLEKYYTEALAVLARSGGAPRGKWASALAGWLARTLSPDFARRLGLAPPVKRFRFDETRQAWEIEIV